LPGRRQCAGSDPWLHPAPAACRLYSARLL
jgi:hypothetical protein